MPAQAMSTIGQIRSADTTLKLYNLLDMMTCAICDFLSGNYTGSAPVSRFIPQFSWFRFVMRLDFMNQ